METETIFYEFRGRYEIIDVFLLFIGDALKYLHEDSYINYGRIQDTTLPGIEFIEVGEIDFVRKLCLGAAFCG